MSEVGESSILTFAPSRDFDLDRRNLGAFNLNLPLPPPPPTPPVASDSFLSSSPPSFSSFSSFFSYETTNICTDMYRYLYRWGATPFRRSDRSSTVQVTLS